MRSSRNWPSALAVAALLAACAPSNRDYHHELHFFGTIVSVSLYDVSTRQDQAALEDLEDFFVDVGNNWYPWAAGELKRINDAIADGNAIEVSEPLANLIRSAAFYESESHGRFNAGLGRLSELWGFQPVLLGLEELPDITSLAQLLNDKPGALNIRWDGSTLSSSTQHLMLDLGGIAKGAILAISTGILEQHGIENAIVNIGGDLSVMGCVNGRDAYVGIRSPNNGLAVAGLNVHANETVATSGNYERFVTIGGVRYTHVFDPLTGYPVEHTASVTVVDTDPVRADAAATALMVGGAAEFDELVNVLELRYALLIESSGDTRLTPGMRERLHWIDASNAP